MDNSKALAVLTEQIGKALIFARREELEVVAPQYEPVVTVLELKADDFTDVGGGNMYPGKSATNGIGDAAGVSFLEEVGGTREEGSVSSVKVAKQPAGYFQAQGDYKVVGTAQGTKLKPDGTPRLSSPREYVFDVVNRANLDFLSDFEKQPQYRKYTSEGAALKHVLELQKFAAQRASTGAELGVIRELVGLPTAFKKQEVANGVKMVFSQIVENNRFKMEIAREIMKTPDGRQAVVNALFGKAREIYGPKAERTVSPGSPLIEEPAQAATPVRDAGSFSAAEDPEADPFVVPAVPDAEADPRVELRAKLEEYEGDDYVPLADAHRAIINQLLIKKDATAAELQAMIDRIRTYRDGVEKGAKDAGLSIADFLAKARKPRPQGARS